MTQASYCSTRYAPTAAVCGTSGQRSRAFNITRIHYPSHVGVVVLQLLTQPYQSLTEALPGASSSSAADASPWRPDLPQKSSEYAL